VSVGGRSPRELLGSLGADLDAAFREGPAAVGWRSARWRSLVRRRQVLVTVAIVVALGASTAAATRSIFSSSPPVPGLAPLAADLASGSLGSEHWQLSVARCSRPAGSVSVLLRAGSGGAGTSCGLAVQPPGAFYDPQRQVTFVFGALPAGTTRAELVLGANRSEVTPLAADANALRAARLPSGARVYVAMLSGYRVVTALTAFDSAGHVALVCQEQRCVAP